VPEKQRAESRETEIVQKIKMGKDKKTTRSFFSQKNIKFTVISNLKNTKNLKIKQTLFSCTVID
jgi:hypothetical protein